MRQQYGFVLLLLLCISINQALGQTTPIPDWQGDPNLCTINQPITPGPPIPLFPNQAEFGLERVEIKHLMNLSLPSEMTMYNYIYDYDANKVIIVKNKNGFIDAEYYYYNIGKKATYYRREFCVVTDIPLNNDMDGASAIQLGDGSWHVRPMNEFLLFSSDVASRRVIPIFVGATTVRGIPVNRWQSCYINKTEQRTVRRIWSFAQPNVEMAGSTNNYAIPVQAQISASLVFPNGTQAIEVDEEFNVFAFRPGILETTDAIAPPKGVFCSSGPGQQLVSLNDVGISWPNYFSVRVETSTSRSARWQRFHLRYDQGREGTSRRLRYDYVPPGGEDFESVILDYVDDITYVIDRRIGTCRISRGTEIPLVNPITDPIRFFIRNERNFIYTPRQNAWEFNGFRSCRGNSIKCTILTTSLDNFPEIVDPDTGAFTGESWEATNVEYGWSMRAPTAPPQPDRPKQFDYPVSLFLRMYRYENPINPTPTSIRTEDIEYEFYEMSYERHPFDFDTSICYRSLNYEYLHVVFTISIESGAAIDRNRLNRRDLELQAHFTLINTMNIKFSRVADLEITHEDTGSSAQVFCTILGRTPRPGSPSGFADEELTAASARDNLQRAIDGGNFQFDVRSRNESTTFKFKADRNSLKFSSQYMSSHAAGKKNVEEKYTSSSQALAVIFGLIIGILIGAVVILIIRKAQNKPLPTLPSSISNPLQSFNVGFKKSATAPSSNA